MHLSAYPSDPPGKTPRILFIHHSCGGQLLADPGSARGEHCIYETHPNGGALRRLLTGMGYEVHEASYGSEIGAKTDIFDWVPKFRDSMERVLTCLNQNTYSTDGKRNEIVVFKSCFPNNNFIGRGCEPGHPDGPDLTIEDARTAYRALLEQFQNHSAVLFVCMTAPPLAGKLKPEPLWKTIARKILRKNRIAASARSGELAREFNNWLKAEKGWLMDYPNHNVVVFDLYDLLTGKGQSNFLQYPSGGGFDSHPNREGNVLAARAFVPFLNRAVRRSILVE